MKQTMIQGTLDAETEESNGSAQLATFEGSLAVISGGDTLLTLKDDEDGIAAVWFDVEGLEQLRDAIDEVLA